MRKWQIIISVLVFIFSLLHASPDKEKTNIDVISQSKLEFTRIENIADEQAKRERYIQQRRKKEMLHSLVNSLSQGIPKIKVQSDEILGNADSIYSKPDYSGDFMYLGTCTNIGTISAVFVKINIMLYDASNNYIGSDFTYVSGGTNVKLSSSNIYTNALLPGEIGFFKVWTSYSYSQVDHVTYYFTYETYLCSQCYASLYFDNTPSWSQAYDGDLKVTGTVKNSSSSWVTYFTKVYFAIFNAGGRVEDVDFTYIDGSSYNYGSGTTDTAIYPGESLAYIGDATFVEGARPDVAAAYPEYPNNTKAGWGYMMLTNFLPNGGNGTFVIEAIATDSVRKTTSLGTKTIICDNVNAVKPFGAIDTPTPGGTTSGSNYLNWGWALTPMPNSIPTDGSTINVYVDSVNIDHPVYNNYREDIANNFPGYANTDGAVGYFYLDTTAYTNGVHTIFWTATDSAGNADGIGSRYFNISNTGSSVNAQMHGRSQRKALDIPLSFESVMNMPISYDPIRYKRGFKRDKNLEIAVTDNYGI